MSPDHKVILNILVFEEAGLFETSLLVGDRNRDGYLSDDRPLSPAVTESFAAFREPAAWRLVAKKTRTLMIRSGSAMLSAKALPVSAMTTSGNSAFWTSGRRSG